MPGQPDGGSTVLELTGAFYNQHTWEPLSNPTVCSGEVFLRCLFLSQGPSFFELKLPRLTIALKTENDELVRSTLPKSGSCVGHLELLIREGLGQSRAPRNGDEYRNRGWQGKKRVAGAQQQRNSRSRETAGAQVQRNIMYRSNRSFNMPPRATPRAFDFFENYCSNSPLHGPKCRSSAPH